MLGYYEDGNMRTLTEEQIKMFRHSEIHRLLSERRQKQRREEERSSECSNAGDHNIRRRRFDDEVPQVQEQVDTLVYDEAPSSEPLLDNKKPKAFLWPRLGP